MIKVHSTTDYSKFKFIRGNRPIDKRVKKMTRAIKRKNQLADYPILTKPNEDGRNYIWDGQTRYEAAKQLNVPIFYIENPHLKIDDIPEANGVQSPWTHRDFIHSWSERGNKHYSTLKQFVAEFGLPITTSAVLLAGARNNGAVRDGIKTGKFTVTTEENARRVASFITSLRPVIPFATDRSLAIALASLMRLKTFDPNRFLQKLRTQQTRFTKCANTEQYLELVEDIYNYRVRPEQLVPLSVEVRKLGR